MNIVALFVTDAQTTTLEQPSKDPFDHATMFAQAAAMFGIPPCNEGLDAALPQGLPDFVLRVVGAVGKRSVGPFSTPAGWPLDRRDRIDQRDRWFRIVDVRGRMDHRQRRALTIAGNMPLKCPRFLYQVLREYGLSNG